MPDISVIHKLDISSATLPKSYERAKVAISECSNLDECKDWSDKAQALASYAKQAGDDELEQMSKRIRARAIRRCGELLKLFDGRGNNQHINTNVNKHDIGKAAGMSTRQINTSTQLSNIPESEFNRQLESNNVPTLTALSEQGKRSREYLSKPKPEGFADAIHFMGYLEEAFSYTQKHEPEYFIGAMDDDQKKRMKDIIEALEPWFDKFIINV